VVAREELAVVVLAARDGVRDPPGEGRAGVHAGAGRALRGSRRVAVRAEVPARPAGGAGIERGREGAHRSRAI
jgi:hypothetical protein